MRVVQTGVDVKKSYPGSCNVQRLKQHKKRSVDIPKLIKILVAEEVGKKGGTAREEDELDNKHEARPRSEEYSTANGMFRYAY